MNCGIGGGLPPVNNLTNVNANININVNEGEPCEPNQPYQPASQSESAYNQSAELAEMEGLRNMQRDDREESRIAQLQRGFGGGECGGAGQGQGSNVNGGTVQLSQGDSFTTPGGCTVNWSGTTVNFNDPNGGGGAQAQQSTQGSGRTPFFQEGKPGQYTGVENGTDQTTTIWGDPHITSPDGNQQTFQNNEQPDTNTGAGGDGGGGSTGATNGGEFTLSDGSKVLVTASGYNKPVTGVEIILPGAKAQFGQDGNATAAETTDYKETNGQWTASGTANQAQNMFPFG